VQTVEDFSALILPVLTSLHRENAELREQLKDSMTKTIVCAGKLAAAEAALDLARKDVERLDFIIRLIHQKGTNGFATTFQWGIEFPFDRTAIDAARSGEKGAE